MLVSDGFDAAVLGVACRCGESPTVIYDLEKCLSIVVNPTASLACRLSSWRRGGAVSGGP
jgi:hypothetical protein